MFLVTSRRRPLGKYSQERRRQLAYRNRRGRRRRRRRRRGRGRTFVIAGRQDDCGGALGRFGAPVDVVEGEGHHRQCVGPLQNWRHVGAAGKTRRRVAATFATLAPRWLRDAALSPRWQNVAPR